MFILCDSHTEPAVAVVLAARELHQGSGRLDVVVHGVRVRVAAAVRRCQPLHERHTYLQGHDWLLSAGPAGAL